MKHLLFDDNGDFKAGSVLSEAGASLQVELASGKRVKIKSAHVLLRFDAPAPDALLPAARRLAEDIDVDFLWECAPQQEFAFTDLAQDYFGRAPGPVEAKTRLRTRSGPSIATHWATRPPIEWPSTWAGPRPSSSIRARTSAANRRVE